MNTRLTTLQTFTRTQLAGACGWAIMIVVLALSANAGSQGAGSQNNTSCSRLTEPFSSEDLIRTRINCKITKARDIRKILPDSYRSNFTFTFSKRSAVGDCIDSQKPRTILFSSTNKLVIAFPWSGSAVRTKRGVLNCNVIEMTELSKGATELNFLQDSLPLISDDFALLKAYQAETQDCQSCHFKKAIYDSYPEWRDFFGSDDDTLIIGSEEEHNYRKFYTSMSSDDKKLFIWPTFNSVDAQALTTFSDKSGKHLLQSQPNLTFDAYSELPPYQRGYLSIFGHYSLRPNLVLGRVLSEMHAVAVYNELVQQESFGLFKKFAALNVCGAEFVTRFKANHQVSTELNNIFAKIRAWGTRYRPQEIQVVSVFGETLTLFFKQNLLKVSNDMFHFAPMSQHISGFLAEYYRRNKIDNPTYYDGTDIESIKHALAMHILFSDRDLRSLFLRDTGTSSGYAYEQLLAYQSLKRLELVTKADFLSYCTQLSNP